MIHRLLAGAGALFAKHTREPDLAARMDEPDPQWLVQVRTFDGGRHQVREAQQLSPRGECVNFPSWAALCGVKGG